MEAQERRRYPRVELPLSVQFQVRGDPKARPQTGLLLNLSAGGLRFTGAQPLERGTKLEFQIGLLRKELYVLTGAVMWTKSLGTSVECGVEFTDLSPTRRAELDEIVQFLTKPQEDME